MSAPTADPSRVCASEDTRDFYSTLAEELDIDGWAKGIDNLVVDVEKTYESISDKLFHYRLFMWGMAMEVVIIGMIAGLLVH